MNENVKIRLEQAAGLMQSEAGGDYSYKRLHVSQSNQLYWYYSLSGFELDVVVESSFPSGCGRSLNTANIRVHEVPGSEPGMFCLHFTLKAKEDRQIFIQLILDLIDCSDDCVSSEVGVTRVVSRFAMWKAMLKHRGEGRGVVKGVIGELLTMKMLIKSGKDPEKVVEGWGGIEPAKQDFVLADMWVETKSVGTHATVVTINSLAQLDKPDRKGYLHVIFMDECQEGEAGAISFVSMFDTIDMMLVGNTAARIKFKERIREYEYHRFVVQEPIYFKVQETKVYNVDDSFPKLKSSAQMPGINSVHYDLLLGTIETWAIAEGESVWQ